MSRLATDARATLAAAFGKRPFKGAHPMSVIVPVLIVLLVGGVLTIVSLTGTDDRPYAKLHWWLEGSKVAAGDGLDTGSWLAGDVLAVAARDGLTGYEAATGARRWTVSVPSGLCGTSAQPARGLVALSAGASCDRLAVVDLARGTVVRRWTLPGGKKAGAEAQVAITNDIAVVHRADGAHAYRLGDGRPAWRRAGLAPGCAITKIGGGAALLAEQRCGASRAASVHRVDPRTGRARWSRPLPGGTEVRAIVSAAPAVLGLGRGAEVDRIVALDERGAEQRSLAVHSENAVHCDAVHVAWCRGAVLDGATLYLRVGEPGDDSFSTTPISAVDLSRGGGVRWRAAGPDRVELVPVAVEGGRLIAAHPVVPPRRRGYAERPSEVVALDAVTGRSAPLLEISTRQTGVGDMIAGRARLHYGGDRLLLVRLDAGRGREPGAAVYGPPPSEAER
ncbi:PQQ-binding-like beta-propeller repeat protein [Spirillospora sp. CA-253888]